MQHSRIAVAFVRWNFFIVFRLKTMKNSSGKIQDCYALMLRMNLPIYCIALLVLSAIVSAPHSVTIKAATNFSDSE